VVINADGRLGTAPAPSLAELMARLDRQEKEIAALRRELATR
jgi:hypothetical protein